jgi:hypothetical protein
VREDCQYCSAKEYVLELMYGQAKAVEGAWNPACQLRGQTSRSKQQSDRKELPHRAENRAWWSSFVLELYGIIGERTHLADSCCDAANGVLIFASLGLVRAATDSRYCSVVACSAMPSPQPPSSHGQATCFVVD